MYPHQSLGIGVGLLVQDKLGHLVVAAVGGNVQRRQVVVGDIVHGHVVLQQELHTVEVVALSGHVERRQTVLRWGQREGKKERERKGREKERGQTKRERHTHADGHVDRWTDRHSQLGRGRGAALEDCKRKLLRRLQKHCYNGAITTMSILLHWSSCAVKLCGYAAETGCSGEVAHTL